MGEDRKCLLALSGQRTIGEAVIAAGRRSVGCEVGNFLVQEGRRVAVIEMLDSVATDVYSMVRVSLLEELDQAKNY